MDEDSLIFLFVDRVARHGSGDHVDRWPRRTSSSALGQRLALGPAGERMEVADDVSRPAAAAPPSGTCVFRTAAAGQSSGS